MKSTFNDGENENKNENTTSNILLQLRSLINTDDDNTNSYDNNNLKLQEREKLIDELKKLVDSSSRPNRRVIHKKKKKKKIKRQDLLKEILEDSSSSSAIARNSGANATSYIDSIPKNEIHSHSLNLTEESFKFDFDSHRFGVNLYNDNLFQEFGLMDNHLEVSDSNSSLFQFDSNKKPNAVKHEQGIIVTSESPQLHAKDVYQRSSPILKRYLNSYRLLETNSSEDFREFVCKKVDILGFARQHSLLEEDIPKPDPELLKILGLPMEYNPYLIDGRPSNIVLVYSRPLEQFRIKHDLLSDIQKKELKKYRNRIASRKFRRAHSKVSKNHNDADKTRSLYETIIFNLMPEIEKLEENLKKLISENENLNEQLKLKYKQKLTI